MNEPVNELLRYAELTCCRERLASGDFLTTPERQRFAASMLSHTDVDLLQNVARIDRGAAEAADALFVLFTHGGVGNLNASIRPWLDCREDDSEVTESASLVLAGCVKQLSDGTALRMLLEFREIEDINIAAEQVLQDVEEVTVCHMLRLSRFEQISELLEAAGRTPSNRFLWTLRTYGRNARVRTYLHEQSAAGSVAALVSLTIHEPKLAWPLVAAARAETEFETRLLVNVALENIRRGASWHDTESAGFLSGLRSDARAMLFAELEAM